MKGQIPMKRVVLASFKDPTKDSPVTESTDFTALYTYVKQMELDFYLEQQVWNDPNVDWSQYSLVMIDTTWDYHKHPQKFSSWLDLLVDLEIPVINPVPLIKWNMSKKYLLDLYRKRFRVPRSLILDRHQAPNKIVESIQAYFPSSEHPQLVVKPVISASSYKTNKINNPITREGEEVIADITGDTDLLVQEYGTAIEQGEYSIIFISGQYTHSMIKIPKSGEFRSQAEFGGEVKPVDPPPRLIDMADRLLDELPVYPVYARIDVVFDGITGMLMECEVIEPYLFLSVSEIATKKLVEAILHHIK